MKNTNKHLSSITLALLAMAAMPWLAGTARGQTSTNALSPSQTFFQTAVNYFTSANTNYTWNGNTLEIAAGADYMSSVNWAQYLDAQYDVTSSNSFLSRLAFEAKMRNAGIAGTVESIQGGPELTLISYNSVKFQAGLSGGYDLYHDSPLIEPKLTLRDKLTPNTFAGICLSLPIWTHGKPINNVPDIGLEAGFTY